MQKLGYILSLFVFLFPQLAGAQDQFEFFDFVLPTYRPLPTLSGPPESSPGGCGLDENLQLDCPNSMSGTNPGATLFVPPRPVLEFPSPPSAPSEEPVAEPDSPEAAPGSGPPTENRVDIALAVLDRIEAAGALPLVEFCQILAANILENTDVTCLNPHPGEARVAVQAGDPENEVVVVVTRQTSNAPSYIVQIRGAGEVLSDQPRRYDAFEYALFLLFDESAVPSYVVVPRYSVFFNRGLETAGTGNINFKMGEWIKGPSPETFLLVIWNIFRDLVENEFREATE